MHVYVQSCHDLHQVFLEPWNKETKKKENKENKVKKIYYLRCEIYVSKTQYVEDKKEEEFLLFETTKVITNREVTKLNCKMHLRFLLRYWRV